METQDSVEQKRNPGRSNRTANPAVFQNRSIQDCHGANWRPISASDLERQSDEFEATP